MSPTIAAITCVLALPLAPACGDDGEAAEPDASASGRASSVDWPAQFEDDASAALVAALAQPHDVARRAWSGHQVHWILEIDLGPVAPPTDDPDPPLDRPVVRPQHVRDELTLRWTGTATDPGFELTQANQVPDQPEGRGGRGRDVIVAGERVYVRHPPRPWVAYPLESPLWQQWLDDAWFAPRDVVGFVAPAATMSARTVAGGGHDGGDAIEVTLSRAESVDESKRAKGPTQLWRADATIEEISGTVRIDAASGLWMSADLDVSYAVPGADGTPQAGHLQLSAAAGEDPGAAAKAPSEAVPLPQRPRYDAQARTLLDGLAAPPP